jgi:hypothetical protein
MSRNRDPDTTGSTYALNFSDGLRRRKSRSPPPPRSLTPPEVAARQVGVELKHGSERPQKAKSTPAEAFRRTPWWAQWVIGVLVAIVGPSGASGFVVAYTNKSDSDKLDEIKASVAKEVEARERNGDRLDRVAERLARVEGRLEPILIQVQKHESTRTRVVAASSLLEQGKTREALRELSIDVAASELEAGSPEGATRTLIEASARKPKVEIEEANTAGETAATQSQ